MATVPQQKLDNFFKAFPGTIFKKGTTILGSGFEPTGLFYLSNGLVRQYIFTEHGKELTLHFFKHGAYFPLFWALNELPNKYNYQALTKVEAHIAPKGKFLDFIKSDPEILLNLTRRLLFGLDGLLTRVESLVSLDARQRTIEIILFLGKHFGLRKGDSLTLSRAFTHEDISNLTGLTRETTSRVLEDLTRHKLIITKDHLITIPNLSQFK